MTRRGHSSGSPTTHSGMAWRNVGISGDVHTREALKHSRIQAAKCDAFGEKRPGAVRCPGFVDEWWRIPEQ